MSAVKLSTRIDLKDMMRQGRDWLSALNLHIAGIALLALVNIYLLIHMAVLWRGVKDNNAAAQVQQQIELKSSEIAAQPLRGLDAKLEKATTDADKFYKDRLPGKVSDYATELGVLTKKQNVRFLRGQYMHAPILAGTSAELTEVRIDASFSGDYRQLVQFINSLERDKMFFVIDRLTFTGQQSGNVSLRLGLRTFLRGHVVDDDQAQSTASPETASATGGAQ